MLKEAHVLDYLCRPDVPQITFVNVVMQHLPIRCVQDIFWLLQYPRPFLTYPRYFYVPSTCAINMTMFITSFTHLIDGYSVFVNAQANVAINNMLAA